MNRIPLFARYFSRARSSAGELWLPKQSWQSRPPRGAAPTRVALAIPFEGVRRIQFDIERNRPANWWSFTI
jgi:hypothetical protein